MSQKQKKSCRSSHFKLLGGLHISYHPYLFPSLLDPLTFPLPSRLVCLYQCQPFPYVSHTSLSISPPPFSPPPHTHYICK